MLPFFLMIRNISENVAVLSFEQPCVLVLPILLKQRAKSIVVWNHSIKRMRTHYSHGRNAVDVDSDTAASSTSTRQAHLVMACSEAYRATAVKMVGGMDR